MSAPIARGRSGLLLTVSLSRAFLIGALFTSLPGLTAQSLPGTDIRTWATASLSGKLSMASVWTPADIRVGLIGPFYTVVKLGAEQREGLAMGDWGFDGSFASAATDTAATQVLLLAQQPNGTLKDQTADLLGNAGSKGIGSVIAGDFNADGLQDIFYSAHNESPFIGQSSVAFMSQPGGSLRRVDVGDQAMNHHSQLYRVNGKDMVIATSFGGKNTQGNTIASASVIYTWNGSSFTLSSTPNMSSMATVGGAFAGDDRQYLVAGDFSSGPGIRYAANVRYGAVAYRLVNNVAVQPAIMLPKGYFNDKPEYDAYQSEWDFNKTHTPRVLSTDLNQDGLPDVVGLSTIWKNMTNGHQKSVLQLLINRGNMTFSDDTDALAPEYNKDATIDYSARFADVDGSGIETLFTASSLQDNGDRDDARQGQYILVNDGTGHLYAAMHAEFRGMSAQVVEAARAGSPAGYTPNGSITPQFIAYRNADGKLNFVAVIRLSPPSGTAVRKWAMVNVAVGIDLTTDFRRDLTVRGRNGSRRIRTFAGNDIIYRAQGDPNCQIDGGLGRNVAVFPGAKAAWSVRKEDGRIVVRPASGSGGADTLTRIQTARFDDGDIDLEQF